MVCPEGRLLLGATILIVDSEILGPGSPFPAIFQVPLVDFSGATASASCGANLSGLALSVAFKGLLRA